MNSFYLINEQNAGNEGRRKNIQTAVNVSYKVLKCPQGNVFYSEISCYWILMFIYRDSRNYSVIFLC
jgi:hypothetical protein